MARFLARSVSSPYAFGDDRQGAEVTLMLVIDSTYGDPVTQGRIDTQRERGADSVVSLSFDSNGDEAHYHTPASVPTNYTRTLPTMSLKIHRSPIPNLPLHQHVPSRSLSRVISRYILSVHGACS